MEVKGVALVGEVLFVVGVSKGGECRPGDLANDGRTGGDRDKLNPPTRT